MTALRRMRARTPASAAALTALAALAAAALGLSSCAAVKPYEREKLADPIMDPASPVAKQSLEQKFYTTREGSAGGESGIGGGCGCAK